MPHARHESPPSPIAPWGFLRQVFRALSVRQLLLVLLFVLLVAGSVGLLGFRFQLTGSAPRGIYRFVDSPLERGSLVIACPPKAVAIVARERGYLYPGPCDGGVAPMLKTVVALPGDTVRLDASGIAVNGVAIAGTALLERDSKGRVLSHPPFGEQAVVEGMVWLVSSYTPLSWDSRYFGPVPRERILAVAEGVLTEAGFGGSRE